MTDCHLINYFFKNCTWWEATDVVHTSHKLLGLHSTVSSEPNNL